MHNPFRLIMLIFLTFQSKSHMSLSQSLSTIDPIEGTTTIVMIMISVEDQFSFFDQHASTKNVLIHLYTVTTMLSIVGHLNSIVLIDVYGPIIHPVDRLNIGDQTIQVSVFERIFL